jgi:hypothetical protein
MIGWYVHHQGRGHLQQFRLIASHLTTPVTVLSSIDRPPWWGGEWVCLPSDVDVNHPADVRAGGVLHWAPVDSPGVRRRGAAIAAWIDSACPRAFVTDVSVEVTLLARILGVPVIVAAMRGTRTDRAHMAAYDCAHALLAPWPVELNPADWPRRWNAKTWNVGAFSAFDATPRPPARPGMPRNVLVVMGAGGSDVSMRTIADARAATPGWTWRSAGVGAWLSRAALWRALCDAHVVITHAGQNAVAEVAAARRPAVVVAQPRPHGEQLETARTLDCAGIATGLDRWPAPEHLPRLLNDAAARGGETWRKWSRGDGAQRAAQLLDQLVARLGEIEPDGSCARH